MTAGEYLLKLSKRVDDFQHHRHAIQAAAICYRFRQSGSLETLVLSSRDTERWIIPKGNIELDERPHKAAKREAFEEAGVTGKVSKQPIGFYSYVKSPAKPLYLVSVFLLRVAEEREQFREKGQRIRQWIEPSEAAALVAEPELKGLFRLLQNRRPESRLKASAIPPFGRRFANLNGETFRRLLAVERLGLDAKLCPVVSILASQRFDTAQEHSLPTRSSM